MIGIAPQEGMVGSAGQLAVQAAIASPRAILPCVKNFVNAAPGFITSTAKNAGPSGLKVGTKRFAKTSDSESEGLEKTAASVAPVVFQNLMACLIPQATDMHTASRCEVDKTLGATTSQGKQPTGAIRKAEGAALAPKSDEGGSPAKLAGDAKTLTLEQFATRSCPATSAAVSAVASASAASIGQEPWSVPAGLNHVVSRSPLSSISDVKAAGVESGTHSGAVHEASADMQRTGESTIISATPGVLEVGITSGTHGWLRLRAEVGVEGQITASLVTQHASAAEILHKELPSISAFLASEQVGISHVIVHAAESGAGAQNAAMSFGRGAGERHNQREQRRGPLHELDVEPLFSMNDLRLQHAGEGWGGFGVSAALFANGGGGWLSVRV